MPIDLRRAGKEDCDLIFSWRNHPDVRRHFFEPKEIPYAEHKQWFEDSLKKPDRMILLAWQAGQPVGVIRFDFLEGRSEKAEIDIYVAPGCHGRGIGKEILAQGEAWVRENTGVSILLAKVKKENRASIAMFESCGFQSSFVEYRKNLRSL
jgi:UDP-2,4-diacetamido-2,4,6-trideoxy-beta-L-altropyranose hydrolase